MMHPAFLSAHARARWVLPASVLLLAVLAWPGMRHELEAGMTRHMLLQFPLIALAGYGLCSALPKRWEQALQHWNEEGVSGLFGVALALALLMIPHLLDLALVDMRVEAVKWLLLLLCGLALRLSWRRAGWLVQGFFLGNVLPMTVVVGYLFESSPVRLCNAYLLDDQEKLGEKLIWISATIAAIWFTALMRAMMKNEATLTDEQPPGRPKEAAHGNAGTRT